jgi:hypothetical protein
MTLFYQSCLELVALTEVWDDMQDEPEAVAGAMTSSSKALFDNSPCNLTCHVMYPVTMKGIAEIAGNIPIISDEIYQGLIYKGQDHSILEYTGNAFCIKRLFKAVRNDWMEASIPDCSGRIYQATPNYNRISLSTPTVLSGFVQKFVVEKVDKIY